MQARRRCANARG
uniref:Uncharacterized protein n=1 Tax=Arundo donax TaxID=35708 RepID=A0A0A9GUI2_ARUDO